VPRHVARLVTRLIAPLVVDYFASARLITRLVAPLVINYSASRRLVIDYFTYARVRVPWHVARLVTPPVVDYSASRNLVIDYFAYAARPGSSSRHATRHAAHHAARRRQLHLAQARRRLLRLRRASGCLGTSRGSPRNSSRRSSSATSPPPRVQVPRHVARLVTRWKLAARR
jgi:hypothetical protein